MLYKEEFEHNGRTLQKTWSDAYTIRQLPSGLEYYEAVDVLPTQWQYEETENLKQVEEL